MHLFDGHLDLLLEKEQLGIIKKDMAAPLCAVNLANDREYAQFSPDFLCDVSSPRTIVLAIYM